MAIEQPGTDERDEYGIDRRTAEGILTRYLRDTLGEPDARIQAVRLEEGRWQARVQGSRRGVGTVFLQQHTGTVVAGHTAEPPLVYETTEASHRHEVHPDAESVEQDSGQSIPYSSAALEEEAAAEPGQMHFQTLKWHDPTGHRSEPAGHGGQGGSKGRG